MDKVIEVFFEKIGHNGVSIGKFNNKIVFVYGVLPKEKAKIKVLKETKNFIEGEIIEIIEKSHFRVENKEGHYLSCSPWQVFNYDFQIELKKNLLNEIFEKFAKEQINLIDFYKSPNQFYYRTKIEYSFLKENNKWHFSFYKRGSYKYKVKLNNFCILMNQKANDEALKLLDFINNHNLIELKSLILRRSKYFNDIHISLLTNQKQNLNFIKNNFINVSGFIFAYSNPKSSGSVFSEILENYGQEYIREKILNMEFKYHYQSFFQNNIELFEEVLNIMKNNSYNFKKMVDLYCGIGVIGLSLKDFASNIIGVDYDKNSIQYAILNSLENNISNFSAYSLLDSKIDSLFLQDCDLLILDPPRSGLHPKLIKKILDFKPKNIFYLSCNPITQARDYFNLKQKYKLEKIYGFDFYPNTPHIESLIILKLKN